MLGGGEGDQVCVNLKVCMVAHSIEVCVCVLPWLSLCDRLDWGGGHLAGRGQGGSSTLR